MISLCIRDISGRDELNASRIIWLVAMCSPINYNNDNVGKFELFFTIAKFLPFHSILSTDDVVICFR